MSETSHDDLGEVTEAELLQLLADEFAAGGLAVDVVQASGAAPAQLICPIAQADGHPPAVINTYFIPAVSNPSALQYFVTLAYEVSPHAVGAVSQFVCFVNTLIPATGFEFGAAERVCVFRHTHAVSLNPLDPGVVAWSLSMVHAAVANFAPLLGEVASGGDVDAAMATARSIIDELAAS